MSLSFLGFLEEYKNEKELSQLVHIGTCGLHTSQFYETWRKRIWLELKKTYHLCKRIFDESPSRRADYEAIAEAIYSDYLLQDRAR